MMLPLPCLFLALAFTSVTVTGQDQGHAHPALAETRASDSGSSEAPLGRAMSPVSRRAETSSDLGLGSQYVLEELRKTKDLVSRLQTGLRKTQDRLFRLQAGQGSTYIRWGRKSCPVNTTLVYTGIAGGKHYSQKGSGSNRLCLTNTPQFDNTANPPHVALLYGSEYENIGNHLDHDVPCSVCLTPQASTLMIPATLTCPPGWTPQYSGHLAAQYHDYYSTDYVCLDGDLENYNSGARDDNGLLFYLVLTRCGSLPCPPYVNDRVVTCVVCSR